MRADPPKAGARARERGGPLRSRHASSPDRRAHGGGERSALCLCPSETTTLAEAEDLALGETCGHAGLADGRTIFELGCGWGSPTLHMATVYPRSRIVAVSNSHSRRAHLLAEAERRGLANLTVVTADMNDFRPPFVGFDRIVSVETFEHMSNRRARSPGAV